MGSLELVKAAGVLEPDQRTLSELAEVAEHELGLMAQAGAEMIEHAICAGEAFLQAKAQCEPDRWHVWLEEHNFPGTTVSNYMRLATYQAVIRRDLREPTFVEAMRHLRGLPRFDNGGATWNSLDPALKSRARSLHEQGMTAKDISQLLGVGYHTIYSWTNPDKFKKYASRKKERARKRRAEREALRKQQREMAIKQAVRKQGGAIAELYAMVERLQDVHAQAQRETEDREARRALSQAGLHYRQMRDEVVRALGVS